MAFTELNLATLGSLTKKIYENGFLEMDLQQFEVRTSPQGVQQEWVSRGAGVQRARRVP